MSLTNFLATIAILLHGLAILVHVEANQNDKDRVLATAERWIRYSILQGERFSYRPKEGPMDESSVPPVAENLLPNSVLEQFDRSQDFDHIKVVVKVNFYNAVMYVIGQTRVLIKEDMDKWEEEQNVPGWVRTLRAISDGIGWRHFEAFDRTIYKLRSREHVESAPAKAEQKFYAKANIDYQKLMQSLQGLDLNRKDVRIRFARITFSGILASAPLFHIVLYQALLNKLTKMGGDDQHNGAGSSHQQRGGKKTPPYKYKKDMARRDYVVYWLSSVVGELKKQYTEARNDFLGKTTPAAREWMVQVVLAEWKKYGQQWDQIVASVEKMGIEGLDDPNIDLIDTGDSQQKGKGSA